MYVHGFIIEPQDGILLSTHRTFHFTPIYYDILQLLPTKYYPTALP